MTWNQIESIKLWNVKEYFFSGLISKMYDAARAKPYLFNQVRRVQNIHIKL